MSTRAERASRAKHHILPLKFQVRQPDGTYLTQVVDAGVRTPKPESRKTLRDVALRDELEKGS